ncbi:MAG TPA: hypothetical protein VGS80_05300 [Ktedonobacterales bacterium]|nr:hypothetical protein [Ktedonobacterales bacterium]
MAQYNVLDVTVRRNPCTHGRHHVREAGMLPSPGVLVQARLDTLLSMQPRDTFVAPNPDDVQEEVPVAFVPCDCGGGYVVVPAGVVEEIPGYI